MAQGTCGHIQVNDSPKSLAQFQYSVPVFASSPSTPYWRGVGIVASRSVMCGAKHPA
jgi:hypothetical protein